MLAEKKEDEEDGDEEEDEELTVKLENVWYSTSSNSLMRATYLLYPPPLTCC